MSSSNIQIKRAYDAPSADDGFRVLVDRLWPRGVSKEKAALDLWFKDIAPSSGLRTWFGHKPERFKEFTTKYKAELSDNPKLKEFEELIDTHPKVTLLYAAHDPEVNQAQVLRQFIAARSD